MNQALFSRQTFQLFLSCLFGSELTEAVNSRHRDFLSCLFGSEHIVDVRPIREEFLSCLFGSERLGVKKPPEGGFLSCLFGSELQVLLCNLLIFKEQMRQKMVCPNF